MAKLLSPSGSTVMVRRLGGLDKKKPGVWHILKNGSERKGVCSAIIPRIYGVETEILENVKAGEICHNCWRYEKE